MNPTQQALAELFDIGHYAPTLAHDQQRVRAIQHSSRKPSRTNRTRLDDQRRPETRPSRRPPRPHPGRRS
jgi:hypothetical protein